VNAKEIVIQASKVFEQLSDQAMLPEATVPSVTIDKTASC